MYIYINHFILTIYVTIITISLYSKTNKYNNIMHISYILNIHT